VGASHALGTSSIALEVTTTAELNTDKAVADTVLIMKDLTYRYAGNPIVIQAVREAVKGNGLTGEETCRAIYYYVKGKVKFRNDNAVIEGKEVLITPDLLLSLDNPMGDCDDFSTLIGTMLNVVGIPFTFVTVAGMPDYPNVLSHIYVAAYVDGMRIVMDASHGPVFKWEVPDYSITRKVEW
jgi:transglutaminase-like putative cysteine protease